ncbi:MAG: GNAT family N-acetyltransferase [Candidatus Marinimicrobia bacterium]|nr:GNAT family N-acetyltransferase [Candidatus Neomarinimicrobiota bacterium]MBT4360529.1 GNAT family N-acetyltransferase [Candidatus Neomarinimicrobiota bacterium]MBT4716282.1 GNAT family N-acetyltransferase [Candidatus Neomarinimicrobiota bacterium]MBT4945256.1 GNAT family N-acetyltransferase [Candidatus Neomarinimicrobiota bacterium]MBT5269170.1 GNAT family N-acetyltransferase [Candidatus Neomarinimicrobiota bacterium]
MEIAKISPPIKIRLEAVELNTVNSLERMIFGKARATESRLEKIRQQNALLLVAYDGDRQIGFKLGYAVEGAQTFFSWLGGVHENYRRQGIAQALLDSQEHHVKAMGIAAIYFTSFDRFPAMIQLGRKNNYILVKTAMDSGEKKYWFEKQLI